ALVLPEGDLVEVRLALELVLDPVEPSLEILEAGGLDLDGRIQPSGDLCGQSRRKPGQHLDLYELSYEILRVRGVVLSDFTLTVQDQLVGVATIDEPLPWPELEGVVLLVVLHDLRGEKRDPLVLEVERVLRSFLVQKMLPDLHPDPTVDLLLPRVWFF